MPVKKIIQTIFFVFLVVASIIIIRNNNTMSYHTAEGRIYGTTYHIKYKHTENIDSLLVEEMKKVDASLSMFNKNSTVSQINAGTSNRLDTLLKYVLNLSDEINKKTNGAFDATVAPLVDLWGFGRDKRNDVNKSDVDSVMSFIGMNKLTLLGDSLIKTDTRVELDFSAIAKGLGADLVANYLKKHGIKDYFIEIGGEIVAKGKNEKGTFWIIGVENPQQRISGKPFAAIIGANEDSDEISIATSGNHKNFYIKDGKRYAHTIDPRTGYPSEHEVLSVTVIAPTCAIADAYATAFMVLGMGDAEKILEKDPTLSAYFICVDGDTLKTICSKNFEKYIPKKR